MILPANIKKRKFAIFFNSLQRLYASKLYSGCCFFAKLPWYMHIQRPKVDHVARLSSVEWKHEWEKRKKKWMTL